MSDEIAVVQLLHDWKVGGWQKITAKDVGRASIFDFEGARDDTKDNHYFLAASLGQHKLPTVVFSYFDFRENKGKAKVLYTVSREDWDNYLEDAAEKDKQQAYME